MFSGSVCERFFMVQLAIFALICVISEMSQRLSVCVPMLKR